MPPLEPGAHEVEIEREGYAPQRRTLRIDERGVTLLTPLEALEESAFWRAVPVDAAGARGDDPALEVNA